MEHSVRSGGVVKKKSSSGCLIIKKKSDGLGVGGSSARYQKERKRPRLVMSDSQSSDELLEPVRRKGSDNFRNGSVVYRRSGTEDRGFGNNGEIERERKRNRLDLFDFDEYDEFDEKRARNEYMDHRLKMGGRSENYRDLGSGSRRNFMVEKRKHSYFDGSSSDLGGKKKGVDYVGNHRLELDEDEAHMPISLLRLKYQEASDEPIRLQGKNGVLKVMVNKTKKMDLPHKNYDHEEVEYANDSRSSDVTRKDASIRPSFFSDSKRLEKRNLFIEREKVELKLQKPLSSKHRNAGGRETDVTGTSFKLSLPNLPASSSMKAEKKEEKRSSPAKKEEKRSSTTQKEEKPSSDKVSPVKGKEAKVKRGGSTEKQQLREKIREMLIKAGWTIDYRPRRNRDYLDAVYINPSGTAYWSIIKAYDALQKQFEEEDDKNKPDGVSPSFAPLAEDLINKLTRQTRKKLEKELKKKNRENGAKKRGKEVSSKESPEGSDSDQNEERLSSYLRQGSKLLRGKVHTTDEGDGDNSRTHKKSSTATTSSTVQARKTRKIGRCTLLVRSSGKGQNSESDGYVPYTGKRTLLAWLIDSGTVKLSEKVQYMNRRKTRVKLEGWITREGIHCGCCSKILPVSKFELHAGSKLRQPFQNIYLESGASLLQCQIDAWNRQEESERKDFYTVDVNGDDPDDDTCGICGDGGALICCDSCPSTFHQSCLGIQMLPLGDWHCPNCACKFCGVAADESSEIFSELLQCSLCEKKYHKSCSQEVDSSQAYSFCEEKCQELHEHLQKIIGVKHELDSGFSWSLIQRTDIDTDVPHRGLPQRVECNSKLAVALSVMDECFLPIVDRRSGINIIHNVLYNCGSNFNRLNYRGFYTAILERGDEIICAASIRIHGTQLAEMPFIGTRHIHRRQGMCRRLLSAIELVLVSLKVEKLIIPAISEHMHTWTVVFGFDPLIENLRQEMKSMNMLVFPGTDMLQKHMVKQDIIEGEKAAESKENHPQLPALVEKSDVESCQGNDRQKSDEALLDNNKTNEKEIDLLDSDYPMDAVQSNGISHKSDIQGSTGESIFVKPETINKLAELSPNFECPSSSVANVANREMEVTALSPSATNEIPARNALEETSENKNQISVSIYSTSEIAKKCSTESNNCSAVEIQSKALATSEISCNVEVPPLEGDTLSPLVVSGDGASGVDLEDVGLGSGSLMESSFHSHKQAVPEKAGANGESLSWFNLELDQPTTLNVESGKHVSPDLPSDAKIAADAKITHLNDTIECSAVSDGHRTTTKGFCSVPASDISEETSQHNSHFPDATIGCDNGVVTFKSSLINQNAAESKGKVSQSSTGSGIDETCDLKVESSPVETVLDSSAEISAKYTDKKIIAKQNQQAELQLEIRSCVDSDIAALAEMTVSPENEVGYPCETNGNICSVESMVNSSSDASTQYMADATNNEKDNCDAGKSSPRS